MCIMAPWLPSYADIPDLPLCDLVSLTYLFVTSYLWPTSLWPRISSVFIFKYEKSYVKFTLVWRAQQAVIFDPNPSRVSIFSKFFDLKPKKDFFKNSSTSISTEILLFFLLFFDYMIFYDLSISWIQLLIRIF